MLAFSLLTLAFTLLDEVDGSPARADAGANNGDASTLNLERLEHLYSLQPGETGGSALYSSSLRPAQCLTVLSSAQTTTTTSSRSTHATRFIKVERRILASSGALFAKPSVVLRSNEHFTDPGRLFL